MLCVFWQYLSWHIVSRSVWFHSCLPFTWKKKKKRKKLYPRIAVNQNHNTNRTWTQVLWYNRIRTKKAVPALIIPLYHKFNSERASSLFLWPQIGKLNNNFILEFGQTGRGWEDFQTFESVYRANLLHLLGDIGSFSRANSLKESNKSE